MRLPRLVIAGAPVAPIALVAGIRVDWLARSAAGRTRLNAAEMERIFGAFQAGVAPSPCCTSPQLFTRGECWELSKRSDSDSIRRRSSA